MKKIRTGTYLTLAIMVLMLVIMISSFQMEHWKTKMLPLMLGGITFLMAAGQLWRETRGSEAAEPAMATAEEKEIQRQNIRGYLMAGAWVLGFSFSLLLFGFFIAIPLFIISYMKLYGTSWWLAIVLAASTLGFMYLLSEPLAGIPLYRGLVFSG